MRLYHCCPLKVVDDGTISFFDNIVVRYFKEFLQIFSGH